MKDFKMFESINAAEKEKLTLKLMEWAEREEHFIYKTIDFFGYQWVDGTLDTISIIEKISDYKIWKTVFDARNDDNLRGKPEITINFASHTKGYVNFEFNIDFNTTSKMMYDFLVKNKIVTPLTPQQILGIIFGI